MKNVYKIEKSKFIAFIIFLLIIIETAFENTPLQHYNLLVNQIFLLVEVILFIAFLGQEKFLKKNFYILVGLFAVFICSYFVLNSSILIRMFMFSTVVSKISIEKSFEILFKFKTAIILFVVSLSLVGILSTNHMLVEKGIGSFMGYGLGYSHPNRLASAIIYSIMCYVGWKKEKIHFLNFVSILGITLTAYYITHSRTLIYCTGILFLCFIFVKTRLFKKLIPFLGIVSFPISTAASIYIPILLLTSSGIIQKIVFEINLLFSRRFTHIEHLFLSYPIPLFGGRFDLSKMEAIFSYTVIDNAYIRFLYQYGIFGLLIFGVVTTISMVILRQKKEYIWICISLIVIIEGLLENIYTDIGQNILLLFWAVVIKKFFYEEKR